MLIPLCGHAALRVLLSLINTSVSPTDPCVRSGGRSQFGVLRVLNDDLVQPKRGFGEHGHSNMEIATYVIDGELTHKDSMGTAESLGRGAIQWVPKCPC